ncbi:hypothetical protein AC578_418 [Pseudocercospora eumusae]|uniref:Secreted protein n=1 Tax=Pseudocercospora eumusae TaxID=321146 RepID=A0A139HY75_9PEZI|nr:hypothetical protein AC578_418 [Pseudocercospora eumusae]
MFAIAFSAMIPLMARFVWFTRCPAKSYSVPSDESFMNLKTAYDMIIMLPHSSTVIDSSAPSRCPVAFGK